MYELAQLNIAGMRTPLDSPEMADFVGNLDRIDALTEQSPGFVSRLKSDEGDATAYRPLGDSVLVNLSVWKEAYGPPGSASVGTPFRIDDACPA